MFRVTYTRSLLSARHRICSIPPVTARGQARVGDKLARDSKQHSRSRRFGSCGPVIGASSFWRTEQSRRLSSLHLRTETDSVSETLCSLEYGTMGKALSNPDSRMQSSRTLQNLQAQFNIFPNMSDHSYKSTSSFSHCTCKYAHHTV
jgi:hypothetical protein